MKPINIMITDEEAKQVKDLKYYCAFTQRDIFLAGIKSLEKELDVHSK